MDEVITNHHTARGRKQLVIHIYITKRASVGGTNVAGYRKLPPSESSRGKFFTRISVYNEGGRESASTEVRVPTSLSGLFTEGEVGYVSLSFFFLFFGLLFDFLRRGGVILACFDFLSLFLLYL